MRTILRRIWSGLHYSEKYGSHPGTFPMVLFVVAGAAAGGWLGFLMMSAYFVPLYLMGAYDRGNES